MKLKTWIKEHKTQLMIAGATVIGFVVGGAVMNKIGYDKTTELLCAMNDDGLFSQDEIYESWQHFDHGLDRYGSYADFDYAFRNMDRPCFSYRASLKK